MAAPTRFRFFLSPLLPVACAALAGCSTVSSDGSLLGFITPYRMEVVQGNVVTQDMVAQLRPGLSGDQVRTLLGAPLLNDVFHANRWDYVFTIRRQGTVPQQRRVTVFFENDRVSRFEADAVPTEREFVAAIDATKPPSRKTVLELDEPQLRAIPVPAPSRSVQAPGVAASGPLRSYPPLETSTR
ncbi:MAG: hypothetical protein RL654_2869 [Pseudomonadota bacterium]|jgi:outer membrane protein assembly factor BamE